MIPGGPFHGLESGSPGDAELQTDVMRFFALLAICLVALMSLAREPAPPVAAEAPAPDPAPAEPSTDPAPPSRQTPPPQMPPARPSPVRMSEPPGPAPAAAAEPAPEPQASPPDTPEPRPEPATKGDPEAPLALRFASAHALERLEAAGEVGVFAIAEGRGYRWSGRLRRFRDAPLPEALYLMDPSTVPPGLVAALAASAPARWGVTLSPVIRARLDRRLAESPRGLLLIDAAGRVRAAEGSE